MASFPSGVVSKPSNITDGLQILAAHVGTAWDEIVAMEAELLGAGTGSFFLDIRPVTAGSVVFQTRQITGDTQPRFQLTGTGDHKWGTGAAATDLTLSRSAARTLSVTGSEVINIQNAADPGLLVKGFASQSALLLDLQNSSAVSQFSVSPAGVVTALTVNVATALTAPTLGAGTNTTGVATTAFVGTAVATATAGALPPGVVCAYAASSAPSGYLLCDGASQLRATYANLFGVIGTTWGSADGTHFNVPDLRGRVIVGTGSGAGLTVRNLAATGGEETHVLSVGEMANHNHGGGVTGAGSANLTVDNAPAFGVSVSTNSDTYSGTTSGVISDVKSWSSGTPVNPYFELIACNYGVGVNTVTSSNNPHSHTFSGTTAGHSHTATLGAHGHSVTQTTHTHTITAAGSSTPFNQMQPFAVLTYIIKT